MSSEETTEKRGKDGHPFPTLSNPDRDPGYHRSIVVGRDEGSKSWYRQNIGDAFHVKPMDDSMADGKYMQRQHWRPPVETPMMQN